MIVVHSPSQNCLLQAINDKIMSMNLTGAIAEPTSVDAQYSLQGGVTVLVTGRITYPVSSSAWLSTEFGSTLTVALCVTGSGAEGVCTDILLGNSREGVLCTE